MNALKNKDRIIIEKVPEFDVEKTLECGQVFRYKKLSDDRFCVCATDKYCEIETSGKNIVIETGDVDFFYDYFDLNTDYAKINSNLLAFDELKEPIARGRGIRILKQDLFETIVSFIISSSNNIPRIKGIIERLCEFYGEKKNGYNAFITKEKFKTLSKNDLSVIRAGFREDYLYANKDIITNDDYLKKLKTLNAADAEKELVKLKGVGAKVASCVMLFALSITCAYPVDTWIYKANRTDELNSAEKVRKFYSERYKDLSGLAQQYIFYAIRNPHKKF